MQPRAVTITGPIDRPPALPWTTVSRRSTHARDDTGTHATTGTLLAWRWTHQNARQWTGLVRYQHDGLTYEHWIDGRQLTVHPLEDATDTPVSTTTPSG